MKLTDSVNEVLEKYKYRNLPLEEAVSELASSIGAYSVSSNKREELAHLLCEYKWNKISRVELSEEVRKLNCFQEVMLW